MADDLAILDRRITDALAALRCARAVVECSANSTTRWHEDMAQRVLDGLLDQRPRAQMKQQATVLAEAIVGSRSGG
ncbi:hypothetical protein E4P40_00925 [Blastococcus sp. CT_GayMR20]|uniref:hypothetical protein n=1 Tax=Blastococcus sp. CT_GayMR20 TaxID=2559609 RepID=UPI001073F5EF|nr:hypothetical protein [Blastococcus sp. CT_GayMR20]TFV92980.1 hypothetical protein E4P40_00925 [Blastococcus sp. CT_GayMR20]